MDMDMDMDTGTGGGCAPHRTLANYPAASSLVGTNKKRPETDDGGGGRPAEKTRKKGSPPEVDGMDLDVAVAAVSVSKVVEGTRRKRMYEYGKYEDDREMDKMFKCNYWEDPAFADDLQRDGLEIARNAALDNFSERAHRDTAAWLAQLKDAPPPPAAGR